MTRNCVTNSWKNLQTRTLQRQLMSKPSLFNDFCQEISKTQSAKTQSATESNVFTSGGFLSLCTCRGDNSRRKNYRQILFFDYSQKPEHNEDCQFYLEGRKKTNLNIGFSWASTLISHSIQIMAGLTIGAGGTKVCASIDWVPIVAVTSPAVSLLLELKETFLDCSPYPVGNSELPLVELETAHKKLLELFTRREAHPKEIDENGQSLLYVRVCQPSPGILTYPILACNLDRSIPYGIRSSA